MLDTEMTFKPDTIFDGHYKLIRPLSTEGGTADVWLAIDINTIDVSIDDEYEKNCDQEESGMLVAIKIYRPKNALDIEGEQRFRDEFKIVFECRHENLLQPTNFSIFEGIPYLVLPYCKNGSSEQLIGNTLSSDDIWKFISDVSSGLNRLHTNETPIIHQDIKPANILIDNNKDYAITDFGISSKRGGVHGYYYDDENSGTMAYMAPERFMENAEPMSQSDIWAFGATLYEILTGKVPFGEEGGKYQLNNSSPIAPIANIPSDIQRLISDCLNIEPGNRPSAETIKNAAIAKQYPKKSNKKKIWMAGIGVIAVIVIVILFFTKAPIPAPETPIEELYQTALTDINSDDATIVRRGVTLMDSLSSLKYIPAIYQMAYTYGWYMEEEALKRKKLLGIEFFEEKKRLGFPKNDRYSNDAMARLSKILELNDSTHAEINAQAAYRLACYYGNQNQTIKSDYSKSKFFLTQSKKWAELSKDSDIIDRVNKSLENLN